MCSRKPKTFLNITAGTARMRQENPKKSTEAPTAWRRIKNAKWAEASTVIAVKITAETSNRNPVQSASQTGIAYQTFSAGGKYKL